MFFKRKEPQNTPQVKKVSELINSKSHIQKKYVSIMLVPSYSTGKTRSLRIPRTVLYGFVISAFVIFSIVMGFYLRSLHFQRVARDAQYALEETTETFYTFQYEAELAQNELIETTAQMYEQLSEEQRRAEQEIYRQERRHQENMESVWDLIEELEDQVREIDLEIQEMTENLSSRSIIPPIVNILSQMENTQEELRQTLIYDRMEETVPAVGLLGGAALPAFSEEEMLDRLNALLFELDVQRQLLESLEAYKEKMSPYLLNYPTLWPIRGQISSGFGWRGCPFGSSRSEHHNGVDIPARTGTPIHAAGGGTVTFSGWRNGYGNTIVIDHGSGISTKYAHQTRNSVVEGQRVERGEVIGYVGSTGRTTAPHLHYEVHRNGVAINPVPFLMEHRS